MVTIKFNKEAIRDLEYAGLFDNWLSSLKNQWNEEKNESGNGWSIQRLEDTNKASVLIMRSFRWDMSNQGSIYWHNAQAKLKEMGR